MKFLNYITKEYTETFYSDSQTQEQSEREAVGYMLMLIGMAILVILNDISMAI